MRTGQGCSGSAPCPQSIGMRSPGVNSFPGDRISMQDARALSMKALVRHLLLERRHERVHVVLGRVEGAHPADDARVLVPEVEAEALLEAEAHVVRELGEDAV